MKSSHQIFVDTDTGKIVHEMKLFGDTELPGGRQFAGSGTLSASSRRDGDCLKIKFVGDMASFFLPIGHIDYAFEIGYNISNKHGHLSGIHDGYPSYEVYKDGTSIYDCEEGIMPHLLGDIDTAPAGGVLVNRDF